MVFPTEIHRRAYEGLQISASQTELSEAIEGSEGDQIGPPLHYALLGGNLAGISELLDLGHPIEVKNGWKDTPLIAATWANSSVPTSKRLEIVRLLLARGAQVDARGGGGRSALYWASMHTDHEIMKTLIEAGANPSIETNNGQTPLYAVGNDVDFKAYRLLMDSGADINHTDRSGRTPLHELGHTPGLPTKKRTVQYFLDAGALASAVAEDGSLPIHGFAGIGDLPVCKLLYAAGSPIDVADNSGSSPIHGASAWGMTEVVEWLIEKGADVNAPESECGQTPLLYAAMEGSAECARLLIEAGAQGELADCEGFTVLHYAAANNMATVEAVIDLESDLNRLNIFGQTPLFLACANGEEKMTSLLIEAGASIDIVDNEGMTPLDVAEQSGHPDLVRLLRTYESQPSR